MSHSCPSHRFSHLLEPSPKRHLERADAVLWFVRRQLGRVPVTWSGPFGRRLISRNLSGDIDSVRLAGASQS